MNWKKFFFAFIAAFVFLFVFGFLWYATLMHDAHREVPTLLRPEADLKSYFGWLALGQIVQFTIAGAIVGAIYKPAAEHIMYVKERSR
jgi:biotin transporter BioY